MTDRTKTEIVIVLDRSGSMSTMKADMEGGLEQFVLDQRRQPGTCQLTLVQFDTEIETVFSARDLRMVERIEIVPRGGTALLDALGTAIDGVGARLAAQAETERPGKVIVLVITDGEENSSVVWKAKRLRAAIRRQERDYDWQFIYLGANVNAFAEAGDVGIARANAMSYTPGSAREVGAVLSKKIGTYRSSNDKRALRFSTVDRCVANPDWESQLDGKDASDLD